MQKSGVDAIFLMNTGQKDSNFFYLAGFTSGEFEYTSLIVTKKGLILPVSALEYEIAKRQRPKEMKVVKIDSRKQSRSILKRYMRSKIVGLNLSFLPYNDYRAIKSIIKPKKLIDISRAFYDARSTKDENEIKFIKAANKISKKSLAELQKYLKKGMTEKEVAGQLDYLMMKNGASGVAFSTIVSFDANAALPHHSPDGTKLRANGIVLIDFGAKYNNYCADITRTFMFMPEKSSSKYKKFAEIHEIVEGAQIEAFKRIKDGVLGSVPHLAACRYIESAKNGKYKESSFANVHSLGHALGLEVHDTGPGLYKSSKDKLKANMVVSDEPGIYIVGFGGVRIEDDVIVTKTGALMI